MKLTWRVSGVVLAACVGLPAFVVAGEPVSPKVFAAKMVAKPTADGGLVFAEVPWAWAPTLEQGPLTNAMNLRVVTDANGYLVVSSRAYTAADGPLTAMGNIRLRTDGSGHLLVTYGSAGSTVYLADGTAALPSLTFASDVGLDTGLFLAAQNQLGFVAGGSDFARGVTGAVFAVSNLALDIANRDVLLVRVSADTLGQRNGTNAQQFRVGPSTGFAIIGDAGLGYATGLGGTVTQATSKSTAVTLNTVTGEITMNAAALAADTVVSFTLTNSAIAAGDYLHCQHVSAGTAGAYNCTAVGAAGSATVNIRNLTAGSLSEAIVVKYVLFKATTS